MKFENLNILIVEDEMLAALYLKKILIRLGVNNIYHVSNSKDALKQIESTFFDLIFMDINIEGEIDGIECAKLIDQKLKSPIVYTTAFKDQTVIERASDTNLYGYLIKPFKEAEVFAILNIVYKTIKKLDFSEYSEIVLIHGYKVHKNERMVKDGEKSISLTFNEHKILNTLINYISCNVTYSQIIEEAWDGKDVALSTIRDTVSRLKKKLPNLKLSNVSGYGYILNK